MAIQHIILVYTEYGICSWGITCMSGECLLGNQSQMYERSNVEK